MLHEPKLLFAVDHGIGVRESSPIFLHQESILQDANSDSSFRYVEENQKILELVSAQTDFVPLGMS